MNQYAFPVITNAAFRAENLKGELTERIKLEYGCSGPQLLYDYAKERKILPFVAALFIEQQLDPDFWGKIAKQYSERNRNILVQLDRIFEEFDRQETKKAFLSENFGALLSSERDISLFASNDVDIFADICEKDKIQCAFKNLGYVGKEWHAGNKRITTVFYNSDILPDGFGININWEPLSRSKLPCMINADDFVDWSALCYYKNTAIVIPPQEALLYVCLLHVSLHSFARTPDIRLYSDIVNCVQSNPDWRRIIEFAEHDTTLIRTLTSAWLANKLLDVPLPPLVSQKINENSVKIRRLIKLVYLAGMNQLNYEPGRYKVPLIEALCSDSGFGLLKMLFPGKSWLSEVYLKPGDNYFKATLKHIINLF